MAMPRLRVLAVSAAALAALLTLGSCALLSDELAPSATPLPSEGTSPSATASPDNGKEAVITIAGIDVDGRNVSASGYVSGIVEDGGNCLYTFTGITGDVTVESSGVADVVTTSCGLVQSPSELFVRGSWTVTLTYTSQTTRTVSEAVSLEIP